MEYLSEKDYETANQNGLPRKIVYQRFYAYGWEKERAITTPLMYRKAVKPCSVEGCDTKSHARGFCHPHYRIWMRKQKKGLINNEPYQTI